MITLFYSRISYIKSHWTTHVKKEGPGSPQANLTREMGRLTSYFDFFLGSKSIPLSLIPSSTANHLLHPPLFPTFSPVAHTDPSLQSPSRLIASSKILTPADILWESTREAGKKRGDLYLFLLSKFNPQVSWPPAGASPSCSHHLLLIWQIFSKYLSPHSLLNPHPT